MNCFSKRYTPGITKLMWINKTVVKGSPRGGRMVHIEIPKRINTAPHIFSLLSFIENEMKVSLISFTRELDRF
jgi:hypothetical protein